ncbi:MAG: [citrate (pro-3S)-lyase] ligase [Oscillospiraceae bacterium]|nr:[citrate (pro-3S)-lyase] ligase [Oscillospiraceae bacterium]
MSVSQVYQSDKRAMGKVRALLERVDITLDEHLDYTCAVFDEEGQPIATGSAFGPTLRCFAVDPAHQGEGLLNEVITHLMENRQERGFFHLFVYTKPGSAKFFRDLGFSVIAEVPGFLVFLENRKDGFPGYLKKISAHKRPGRSAAIVMNANPFTLGHRYLVETAAKENDTVYLFLLSENAGPIPAAVRHRLVREAVADLPNVVCLETGEYLISSATFPGYFLKTEEKILRTQAALDTALFVQIAQALAIQTRYVGSEPRSLVTGIYNEVLSEALPAQGIECRVIPRRKLPDGQIISASTVRQAIHDNRLDSVADMLPETSLAFFRSPEAAPIVAAIRRTQDVVHY